MSLIRSCLELVFLSFCLLIFVPTSSSFYSFFFIDTTEESWTKYKKQQKQTEENQEKMPRFTTKSTFGKRWGWWRWRWRSSAFFKHWKRDRFWLDSDKGSGTCLDVWLDKSFQESGVLSNQIWPLQMNSLVVRRYVSTTVTTGGVALCYSHSKKQKQTYKKNTKKLNIKTDPFWQ